MSNEYNQVVKFNQVILGLEERELCMMSDEEALLGYHQLIEEAEELIQACYDQDYIGAIDACIDNLYFTMGLLYRLGIDDKTYNRIFTAVHTANMIKKKGVKPGREGFDAADAYKPEDWIGPEERIAKALEPSVSIIVCGMNGSGKSTLVRELSRQLDMPHFHSGLGPKNLIELVQCLHKQMDKIDQGYVIDRSTLFSEQIYGNEAIVPNYVLDDAAHALEDKFILVYCTAENAIALKDKYSDEHKHQLKTSAETLRKDYEQLMSRHSHIKYNFRTDSLDYLVNRIKGEIECTM